MTTAQGDATTTLGARLWMLYDGRVNRTGKALTALGVLNVAVGAVHFFGRPFAERQLDRALGGQPSARRLHVSPTAMVREGGVWRPGLVAVGHF